MQVKVQGVYSKDRVYTKKLFLFYSVILFISLFMYLNPGF